MVDPKHFTELEDGKIVETKEHIKKLEQVEEMIAKKFLDELITTDYSYDNWEKYKDGYLESRVSFSAWEKYWNNNGTKIEKPWIRIAKSGLLISELAQDFADVFSNSQKLFFKAETREIVEVSQIVHEGESEKEQSYSGFSVVQPRRFVSLVEKHCVPYIVKISEDKDTERKIYDNIKTSISKEKANLILAAPHFEETLPMIKRIFTVPKPIMYKGKLTFPKRGYDKRFNSWLGHDAPQIIEDMELEKSKEIILSLFKEFCFQSEQDRVNAIAGLITPFLRGIFSTFTQRTPLFVYEANRERAGKDYLAGITGILYEGHALEEPPISNGEYKSSGTNDELKKKILAAMLQGRPRLHFANNRGRISNAVLEQVTTAMRFSDRILGTNRLVDLPNELDFSLSGNLGMTMTADLANRSRFVKLFLDIEDANTRKFTTPNLHGWILENRGLILSALYSLVNNWIKCGSPDGSVPFASFPEWASICGGIMECAALGNPCVKDEIMLGVSADSETDEMKALFELAHEMKGEDWLSKKDIVDLIINHGDDLFMNIDWDNRSHQTRFGIKLNRFVRRILSDIRLVVEDPNARTARWKYKFRKETSGNLGNLGNVLPAPVQSPIINNKKQNGFSAKGFRLPRLPRLPTKEGKKDHFDELKDDYESKGLL